MILHLDRISKAIVFRCSDPKNYYHMKNLRLFFLIALLTTTLLLCFSIKSSAQQKNIPFDKSLWEFTDARQTEFHGRSCLTGTAYLKSPTFENGVIEVDMAVTGQRSYPGIIFRMASAGDYERIYIRPHLPSFFQNVVQYVSTFNGIDSWQLYTGPGNTAGAEIAKNEWFHVKVEFKGDQARIYLNNAVAPALEIPLLGHGVRAGMVGLFGPSDGTAYFSGFSCREDNSISFNPQKTAEMPFGTLQNWEISPVYKLSEIDNELTPEAQGIANIIWKKVQCRPDGIVDISQYFPRLGNAPDVVFSRTTIESASDDNKQFAFGYSDIVSVFLNGKLLFCGNSSYTSRDPSFQGIVGLNDYISLPLKKGKNELMIVLAETSGGWGFIFQDSKAIYQDKKLVKQWEIKNKLKYPESVHYDPKRDVLYVSNFYNEGEEFISKIRPNGEIVEVEWIKGLLQPAGMCMSNDKLYVVGRHALVEIDPDLGTVVNRYRFPSPGMPNDVAVDEKGDFFITDTRRNLIYRLSSGTMEEWLKSEDLIKPNGICIDKGRILIGTSGDGCIKIVDPESKAISTVVCLGEGAVMDGVTSDGKGNYLISDFNGRLYKISSTGEKQLLLNTTAPSRYCAAFEFIPGKRLLIIPTLYDNRLVAFELTGE